MHPGARRGRQDALELALEALSHPTWFLEPDSGPLKEQQQIFSADLSLLIKLKEYKLLNIYLTF